jgi:methyltransferase OMS1, mitochondrial
MKSKQQVIPGGGGNGNGADPSASVAAADDENADALLGRRGPAEAAAATARRFDALARVYDETVGSEERWMLTGFLRSSLLGKARGKVLEIGAGTGRNAAHYRWPQVDEVIFVDASADMLRCAERKFYDEERVAYRHPHVKARFCLGDAEDLVVAPGEAPRAPPLPKKMRRREEEAAAGAATTTTRRRRAAREAVVAEDEEEEEEEEEAGGGGAFSRLWKKPTTAATRTPAAARGGGDGGQEKEEQEEEEEQQQRPRQQQASSPGNSATPSSRPPPPPPPPLAKFAPGSFDVVVDTFGLCSVGDPAEVLRQAAKLAKPRQQGGRVLLLEHGRPPPGGLWDWLLSAKMDAAAPEHKRRWGCWFNRDVARVVADSGLEVISESRWHFGTTYVYELAARDGEDGGEGEGGAAGGKAR